MMHMTIYWGKKLTLLFPWWKTDSWTSYSLTLLACFLFSVFYQYMEDRRLQFKSLATSSTANNPSRPSIGAPLLVKLGRARRVSPARFATAVLFGVNSGFGYLLMLAIMSYNGGVLVAVVLGLAVGYYVFRSGDDGEEVLVVDADSCACS